jgi:protein phosphatase
MSQFDTENKDVTRAGSVEARAECLKLSQIVHQENDSWLPPTEVFRGYYPAELGTTVVFRDPNGHAQPMTIPIPELSLVVLVGPSGSGKSTFARRHFRPTEVLSSDHFRAVISDDENDQSVTPDAFELLHLTAAKRLALGRLTVIDATNVLPDARKECMALARRYHVLPVAIVFDIDEAICLERNAARPDRHIPPRVVKNHAEALRRSFRKLRDEGFRAVHVLRTPEEADAAVVVREPLRVNRRHDTGPFDIIGDVHGCLDELKELLVKLGYTLADATDPDGRPTFAVAPPPSRKAVFVGDLVDRGPDSTGVLRHIMRMVEAGTALCVRGNHDDKLLRKLRGREVTISHGLAETLDQLGREPAEFTERVKTFLDGLPTHYVLDGGRLVVAHAGLKENLQGRVSERVRAFALYGETTGESDEFGLPVRLNWALDYRGKATVIYGHTPTTRPDWLNRTLCIDTGCAFGGALTAVRYPGSELVSVPARREYAAPKRPLLPPAPGPVPAEAHPAADDVLDLSDVTGRRAIDTRLVPNIVIREGQAAAALEVMSRFAANPRWLVYLPPTMSPCETATEPGYLEYPREAFGYFANEGVARVVCEQKHMGSRAVVIVCRDEATATRRFGVTGEGAGICLTRTGRRFFDDAATEAEFLGVVRQALDGAGWYDRFGSDWFVLDGELMPWSAKAQELLRNQYAATGSAARAALDEVLTALPPDRAELSELTTRIGERREAVGKYIDAYRRYCWPVRSVTDLRFAPFHLLASEGTTYVDRDHLWHMTTVAELVPAGAPVLLATPHRIVEPADPTAIADACKWWEEATAEGSEGMVVKPLEWVVYGRKGLVQPAVKVRGREYLRIIYGPEYTRPEHLERLRRRHLGLKRSLAVREFALGVEALERFVRREPLRRVHECVFGVLALESEPVDPRL